MPPLSSLIVKHLIFRQDQTYFKELLGVLHESSSAFAFNKAPKLSLAFSYAEALSFRLYESSLALASPKAPPLLPQRKPLSFHLYESPSASTFTKAPQLFPL
ncbi:uncharacterized protein G2W53_039592 [Senna tora]|uniref:Uncharacterized protein n=1 Tax=Senna tora TaxID=362788 RepID=A0A834SQ88_9FABA|nr:uncharacterized protein G2W53_039592 [Senna tora]